MRVRVLIGVLSALALATVASAADVPVVKSPWEGFGVGSWAHHKKLSKWTGLSMPDMAEETRQTVVKVTDDAYTIKTEKKTTAGWESAGESPSSRRAAAISPPDDGSGPKVESEDLGTEKITVEGKAFECKKVRTKIGESITTTWTSQTHGVLKTDSDNDAGGGKTHDIRTVTAFAKRVKLAGKELVCRETTLFTKMDLPGMPSGTAHDGTTGVLLESDAVPGRKVRVETLGSGGPVTMTSVEELVAFEAKPP